MRPRAAGTAPSVALVDVRGRVAAGAPPGDLRGLPARVRTAVHVAEQVGAPLLPAIAAATDALDDDRRARRAVRVATAQARAVAAGLLALPVVLVPGLGRLLGLDLLGFYRTPPGRVVLAVAAVLLTAGAGLVVALLRRVGRREAGRSGGAPARAVVAGVAAGLVAGVVVGPVTGAVVAAVVAVSRRPPPTGSAAGLDEVADLVATAVAGGVATSEALRLVATLDPPVPADDLRRLALAQELGHDVAVPTLAPLAAVLRASTEWGAPAAPTLRALARDLRAESLADALAAAERLPAQLTFPTALCLLPASLLLVGAPLVVDGLAAAGAA